MAWKNLREEVGEIFELLQVSDVPVTEDGYATQTWNGFHEHTQLNLLRNTIQDRELLTENQKKDRRAALEKGRSEYKLEKQRGYDSTKRAKVLAARVCIACGGGLARPNRQKAKCLSCGAENFVAPRNGREQAA